MATQKPGEWANTLIVRFEEQVGVFNKIFYINNGFEKPPTFKSIFT